MSTQSATIEGPADLSGHRVVTREEWLAARTALLKKEKEHYRERDRIAAQRRELPWVKIDKDYVFEGPDGKVRLADLFRGRSQLIIYHFMFGPGWTEGCGGCSFLCDHFDSARQHFENRDVALAVVSRGKLEEFAPFKQRMGWKFPWVSSHGSDFNYDFGVSFTEEQVAKGRAFYNFAPETDTGESHGFSVFYKNGKGEIFHTYSCYARGGEEALTTFMLMDLTPKGRNEESTMNWVQLHDQYEDAKDGGCCNCEKEDKA
jgi:predicted dithiol-disulfide oxidoreductase (DUF899 family)